MSDISIVILAAGKGTRMNSVWPKVLQPLAGKPLLAHVFKAIESIEAAQTICVIGYGAQDVKNAFPEANVTWVEQQEQLGTGHAVLQAMPHVKTGNRVLILYGDVPLVTTETLQALQSPLSTETDMSVLTVELNNPFGYGRIVRDASGSVRRIVEQKDATSDEQQIKEINTGLMCVPEKMLNKFLPNLGNNNAQGEYYLTDLIECIDTDGGKVFPVVCSDPLEVEGINDKIQLANLERTYQSMKAHDYMRKGLTLADPYRIDVRGDFEFGKDCFVDANVVIEGRVKLGANVRINAFCHLKDVEIGDGAVIESHSVLEEAYVGPESQIGPFARVRPGTHLISNVKIGNFVEVKKATIDHGSKVNHLSYVGDAEIGKDVNVGAGTITCNYDGANKFKTVLGDRVFIGSDTQLVAPVTIGEGATIGAGSTITKDVPADTLSLSRSPQKSVPGWKRPVKNKA